MNVLHIGASDMNGGAARAAYRIHRSLVAYSACDRINSRMRVINRTSDDPSVIGGPAQGQTTLARHLQPRLCRQARRGFRSGNPNPHSIAWPATGLGLELGLEHSRGMADLVHLHWLGDATISIEEIGHLRMPLVWTIHDQWAFCGAEHYTQLPQPGEYISSDERFAQGYNNLNRPSHESGPDLNRRTWQRKSRCWLRPIQIVSPSTWLADCARRSALMAERPIITIPNPLDLEAWAPFDQRQARALLQLPQDRPLVLFGADGGTADPRKGADLLLLALQRLRAKVTSTALDMLGLVVFGQGRPSLPPELGFPIYYCGRLQDDISLRLVYAAADVMVVPSRQDNLPNTAVEAHACGTPVVAFGIGGLVDIIEDCISGALAKPFDPDSLAAAIAWVCKDPQHRQQLGVAARQRAKRLWDWRTIAAQYVELYKKVAVEPARSM